MFRIDPHQFSKPERLLWERGITEPSEIDLELLAFSLGALVRYCKLDGCDARLVGNGTQAIITINTQSHRARQRFSIAHELGHWLEDRKLGVLPCFKEDIGPQNIEAKNIEALANEFASQLILPDYIFMPRMEGNPVSLNIAETLAKEFSASISATAIKLVKRTSLPVTIVCHSQTKLEWCIKSIGFPQELWIRKELHQNTYAFEMAFGSKCGKSYSKEEPANYWLSGENVFRLSVFSQSVKLTSKKILSIISLK